MRLGSVKYLPAKGLLPKLWERCLCVGAGLHKKGPSQWWTPSSYGTAVKLMLYPFCHHEGRHRRTFDCCVDTGPVRPAARAGVIAVKDAEQLQRGFKPMVTRPVPIRDTKEEW
jgi:hypothetical protein